MDNRKVALLVFAIGLAFSLIGAFSVTGNVIGTSKIYFDAFKIIGLGLMAAGTLLMAVRKGLDAIIIPTGPSDEEDMVRAKRGIRAYKVDGAKYVIVSGNINDVNNMFESQTYKIYDEVVKSGVPKERVIVEGMSRNSVENLRYSAKKFDKHGIKRVGVVSYPEHLDRFGYIFDDMKNKGLVSKDAEIVGIETQRRGTETNGRKAYEFIARNVPQPIKDAIKYALRVVRGKG